MYPLLSNRMTSIRFNTRRMQLNNGLYANRVFSWCSGGYSGWWEFHPTRESFPLLLDNAEVLYYRQRPVNTAFNCPGWRRCWFLFWPSDTGPAFTPIFRFAEPLGQVILEATLQSKSWYVELSSAIFPKTPALSMHNSCHDQREKCNGQFVATVLCDDTDEEVGVRIRRKT